MKFNRYVLISLALLGLFVSFANTARAAVMYTYTGLGYTDFSDNVSLAGEYTSHMNITASFIFDSPLLERSYGSLTDAVVSFAISDGRQTFTGDGSGFDFRAEVDSGGLIAQHNFWASSNDWQFTLPHDRGFARSVHRGSNAADTVNTRGCKDYDMIQSRCLDNRESPSYIDLAEVSDHGSWEVSIVPVPEPSIIALFALGLVGIGFARRRRS